MITDEQRLLRRDRLMGSDAARAITGAYGGVAAVVQSKFEPLSEDLPTEAMEVGNCLEPAILNFAEARLGPLERNIMLLHPELPLGANLDARVIATGEPVEAKTGGFIGGYIDDAWGWEYTSEIPDYVCVQVHVQMFVANAKLAHVAAWLAGRNKLMYIVPRDEALCEAIADYSRFFKSEYLDAKRLPEPDEENAPVILRARKNIERVKETITVDSKDYDLMRRAKDAEKFAHEQAEFYEARFYHQLGTADCADLGDGRIIDVKRIDVPARIQNVRAYSYVRLVERKESATNAKSSTRSRRRAFA